MSLAGLLEGALVALAVVYGVSVPGVIAFAALERRRDRRKERERYPDER